MHLLNEPYRRPDVPHSPIAALLEREVRKKWSYRRPFDQRNFPQIVIEVFSN